ncbi:MAG TPA: hypothetical protein VMN39_09805 [Longimicrobiaceae bacterium]|nr:hypothetical protein [Longimicrobiaceae bacterium]
MSRLLLPILAIGIAGCTAASSGATRPNSSLITEAELAAISVSNVYEAVQRLRPSWLRPPVRRSINLSTEIAVVQNGSYFGSVESLRAIAALNVREIRYLDGPSAIAEVAGILGGGRHIDSAILVRTGGQ